MFFSLAKVTLPLRNLPIIYIGRYRHASLIWKLDLFIIITRYLWKHILDILPHKLFFPNFKMSCNANFSHEIYVGLKKESIVYWCCCFKLITHVLLSFSHMVCNFIMSIGVKSYGLSIKTIGNKWAWCWASTNVTISGGLSSKSRVSKGSTLRSKLGGFILCHKLISTTLWHFKSFPTICIW